MADKIGICVVCCQVIYKGERSGVYVGHTPKCKNVRTNKLS